jgi:putative tricarboxylic transport membrane protein
MGLGLILIGLIIGYEAGTIKVGPLYAKVGPSAFLWFSAGLLILCGAVVAYKATSVTKDQTSELAPPFIILAGIASSIYVMEPAGFIPASLLIFVMTSYGLGSRKLLRDVIIGAILATSAFLVFSKGLGLRLPVGYLFS